MADQRQNHQTDLLRKIDGAGALKDYAIANAISVSDEVIKKIDAVIEMSSSETSKVNAAELDIAIRDLTKATYPATIETVLFQRSEEGKQHVRRLKLMLCAWGIVSLLGAVVGFVCDQPSPGNGAGTTETVVVGGLYHAMRISALAACLGVLGASVFSMYNLVGIVKERALASDDSYSEYLRLALGAIVGWVFFFAFAQDAVKSGKVNNMLLLLPFLAGFSTKLVVGVINKAIQAVQITLGLEDKTSDLQERKIRS
jgi:hypothetical protein